MVVTFLPRASPTVVWQERTALPSRWTVQAPHRPEPHPYLVPVSLRCSRTTQSRAVSGLIVNATAVIGFLPGDGYLRLNRRMVIVFAIGRKSRLLEQRWQ